MRLFWEKNESSDYLDWNQAKLAAFPSLKPTTKAISLRLPESMLAQIKVEANKRDIPYQSLMKMWLSEHLSYNAGSTRKLGSRVRSMHHK
ncbi:MAG: BrnA antitoxin family protein [Gammaproteobacteria bacterium]|nr:BrnA antitoxin family protein [Gammaproteobacteria bacterium]